MRRAFIVSVVIGSIVVTVSMAEAQPTLTASPTEVPSGGAVTVTVSAPAGLYYAIVGSTRDAGIAYGGVALGIGTDVTVLAAGFVPPSGTVSLPFVPPLGSGLDAYYLLAVTSASPDYIPPTPSATVALRPRGFYTNAPTFTQGLSAGGARITDVGLPSGASDGTPKSYVDQTASTLVLATAAFAPVVSQAGRTDRTLINVEQRGSGSLMELRVNSTAVPGANGNLVNSTQFRVLADGGLYAGGQFGIGYLPVTGEGSRLMWYPFKNAFRAGAVSGAHWNDANIGYSSWAGGFDASASGSSSFAFGAVTTAAGNSSVALGYYVGACDDYSVVLGRNATTDPSKSGLVNNGVAPCGGVAPHTGAFVFGDSSSISYIATVANNEFVARAAGGFRFRTNPTLSTGCNLPAGSGVFNCASDRNLKDGFEAVDGEDLLARLAMMPIHRWSYKTEPGVRHMGPVAQDFKAAFGLGVDEVSIGHLDEAGVSLRAIQALELRTRELRGANSRLATENAKLQSLLTDLLNRLARLEEVQPPKR